MSGDDRLTVGRLASVLAEKFPPAWAESWDRIGLLAGDADAEVASVLVTLDADRSAVRRAVLGGHNVLLTHHPAALAIDMPIVAAGSTAVFVDALAAGVALIACHTNLDRSPAGADALPTVLGLRIIGPLEDSAQPMVLVTTFAPPGAADAIVEALAQTGAGRLGAYRECSFTSPGIGRFDAPVSGRPFLGEKGRNAVDEVRIETTCPHGAEAAVAAAIRDVHPYEEPVIMTVDCTVARQTARLGRLCELEATVSLAEFAARCAHTLSVDARVWGDPEARIRRVAVGNGSAGSLVARAIEVGADVLVAGEVRYHDARAALDAGLPIIEAGHDVTEWPLVHVLAQAARDAVGDRAAVYEETPAIDWWTTERR